MKKFAQATVIAASFLVIAGQAQANDDLIKGLIGGMIGAAIVNSGQSQNSTSRSSASQSSVSSAQRDANRRVQSALNYFGFPAGTPDGALGSRSRSAISSYQACLGYPITGQLTPFEQDFLLNSHNRGQAAGQQTFIAVAQFPNGYCGLLQAYRDEMVRPTPVPGANVTLPQFVAAPTVITAPTAVTTNVSIAANEIEISALQEEVDRVAEQIALLTEVLKYQESQDTTPVRTTKIEVVRSRIEYFDKQVNEITEAAQNRYQTPIRPVNANLGTTALRASEIFPKVPYYIPGTDQIGEFWVEPRITDEGYLVYIFNFLDPDAELASVVERIQLSPEEIEITVGGLSKVNEWAEVAQQRNIRKRFEKSAVCFPTSDCAEKVAGNSSTEIVFLTYEDGSTAGQFKRNKGRSSSTYNISNESGLLLSAYLEFMVDVGSKEFEASTMTDEDLSEIFE